MKIFNKICGIGLLAVLLTAFIPNDSSAQGGYVSNQVFYDELSPYGTWVYDEQYGDVWIPDAEDGFRPYGSRGHWVLTEYGNTWVSDYPWGWATFHYGRWRFDDYYGWMWIPDNEWGPAWVNWRQGDGYYGWAPLNPGISLSVSIGSNYRVPDNYWIYAPETYINSPRIYDYYVPRTQVVNIVNRTTIINNTVVINNRSYIGGPRIADIRRVTRSAPQIYRVNDARRPGAINVANNTVNIYRPRVTINKDARPARVVDGDAYRKANPGERIAADPRRGADINRTNIAKLAATARTEKPDDKIVRVNNDNRRPVRQNDNRPGRDLSAPNTADNAQREQRRQEQMQRRQQNIDQQGQQPNAVDNAQREQRRQEQMQRRQQNADQRVQPGQQPNPSDDAQREQRRQEQLQRRQQNVDQNPAVRQQRDWRRPQPEQNPAVQQQTDQQNQQQQMQRQQRQQEQQAQRDQQRQQQMQQRQQEQQAQQNQQQQMQRQQEQQQRQQQQIQQRQQEQQAQRDRQQMQRQQEQQERQQQQMQQQRQQAPQAQPQEGRERRGIRN